MTCTYYFGDANALRRNGRRGGFINIKDIYNNDIGKGGVRVYEGHEVKYRVALVRVPFCFINLWLIPDRQSSVLLYITVLLTPV